jgi:hypothetical protein
MKRPHRPSGHPTRGKTALNRLRQVDVYAALTLESLLTGGSPLIVDVGYGAYPWTALEMVERLRHVNPQLHLLGVEIDPERVAAALPYASPPAIDFRIGGFNLSSVLNAERARLIRCYNVLRQYDESAVAPALQEMTAVLEPDGILIEGTSNPSGRIVAFDVYRRRGDRLTHEALVFGTNFRAPIEAADFQPILPKRLIHHMRDPIPAAFFESWERAFMQRRSSGLDRRDVWMDCALVLADSYPIDRRRGLIRRGYLALRGSLT